MRRGLETPPLLRIFRYQTKKQIEVMELLNKVEVVVTEVTYTLSDETGAFYYKEWINDSGKVIDSVLRDKDGYEIDDPDLLEQVVLFLDEME